jgi:hypothetical protein
MSRKPGEIVGLDGTVLCHASGCRKQGGRSTPIRISATLTIPVVLCPGHEREVARYAEEPIFEHLPDPVIAEGEQSARRLRVVR